MDNEVLRSGWVFDQRGEGRGVRVSAHAAGSFLVLSTWKSDTCVATVRLLPDEAAHLVSNIAEALAHLAGLGQQAERDVPEDLPERVASLEARLAWLENGTPQDPPASATGWPAG